MSKRDEAGITFNVEAGIDEAEIQMKVENELRALLGQVYECGDCGLVWGRKQRLEIKRRRNPPSDNRCPDCREEENIYQINI